MHVYYRGPCARVTLDLFEVWCPQYRAFPIRELYDVQVVRGGSDPIVVRSTSLAGAVAAVFAMSSPFIHEPWAWLLGLGLVLASAGASGACWRTHPRAYELWAGHGTRREVVFRSRDALAFGQVRRALVRAMEHRLQQ
jgi:hypothetical protein